MKPKNKLPPWLRPKTQPQAMRVGVGWYTQDEWVKVKASAEDSERLEATFEEWLAMAEDALVKIRAAGIDAEKSYILASELLAYCLARDLPNNASARAQFVSHQNSKPNLPEA